MNQIKNKESTQSSILAEDKKDLIFQLFCEQMKDENYELIIDFDDYSY